MLEQTKKPIVYRSSKYRDLLLRSRYLLTTFAQEINRCNSKLDTARGIITILLKISKKKLKQNIGIVLGVIRRHDKGSMQWKAPITKGGYPADVNPNYMEMVNRK